MPLLDGDVENSEKHSSRKVRPPFSKLLNTPPEMPPKRAEAETPFQVYLYEAHTSVGVTGRASLSQLPSRAMPPVLLTASRLLAIQNQAGSQGVAGEGSQWPSKRGVKAACRFPCS